MIIRIDNDDNVRLDEPEDCKKFHVEAPAGSALKLAASLGDAGSGDGAAEDHVWIQIAWVRAEASGRVGPSWDGEFDGMVGYAASKGWLNDAKTSIRAHIEWR